MFSLIMNQYKLLKFKKLSEEKLFFEKVLNHKKCKVQLVLKILKEVISLSKNNN